jgi:hypothetical protein
VRELTSLYSQFHHADRIGLTEGYHDHQYSPENQEAGMEFLDHFNGLPRRTGLAPVKELDDKIVQCTRTGQVMLDFANGRSIMDEIHDYYLENKSQSSKSLKELYYSASRPQIEAWPVAEFSGDIPEWQAIEWERRGLVEFEGVRIDKYLLHHSRYLAMPVLHIHKRGVGRRRILLWLGESGKATAQDWPSLSKYLDQGYDIVSFDPRGLGETRMPFKVVSPDDPALVKPDFDAAYVNPLSSVLADYVYNSLLIGRPYFFQMIEDMEIVSRFARVKLQPEAEVAITGTGTANTFAGAASEVVPGVRLLPQPGAQSIRWSELVKQKTELWPIQYLLPGGAYVQ